MKNLNTMFIAALAAFLPSTARADWSPSRRAGVLNPYQCEYRVLTTLKIGEGAALYYVFRSDEFGIFSSADKRTISLSMQFDPRGAIRAVLTDSARTRYDELVGSEPTHQGCTLNLSAQSSARTPSTLRLENSKFSAECAFGDYVERLAVDEKAIQLQSDCK